MSSKPIIESVDAIMQGHVEEGKLFVSTTKEMGHSARNCPNKKINKDKKNQ